MQENLSQGYTQIGTITNEIYTTYLLIFTGTGLCFLKVVLRNPSLDHMGSCTSNDLRTCTAGTLTIFVVIVSAAMKIQGYIANK